jgi:gluconolactonase
MPLRKIALGQFSKIAIGINRPEDIVATRDGPVYASHHDGAVAQIAPDGSFKILGAKSPGAPNGINMDAQGRIIIANFGVYDQAPGPLEMYDPATNIRTTLVAQIGGHALTACNYPVIDRAGNIWCSHSTDAAAWPQALDRRADGFIFVLRPDGSTEIVATGLRFANGMALSADEKFLYCTQTSNADVLRFAILPGAKLGPAEPYGPRLGVVLGMKLNPKLQLPGFVTQYLGYTDGIGFDAEGNLWVTLPAAHMICAITPAGKKFVIAHDPSGKFMQSPTNISWGGPDLTDLYIGDLRANYILKAKSPIPGMPMLHHG